MKTRSAKPLQRIAGKTLQKIYFEQIRVVDSRHVYNKKRILFLFPDKVADFEILAFHHRRPGRFTLEHIFFYLDFANF